MLRSKDSFLNIPDDPGNVATILSSLRGVQKLLSCGELTLEFDTAGFVFRIREVMTVKPEQAEYKLREASVEPRWYAGLLHDWSYEAVSNPCVYCLEMILQETQDRLPNFALPEVAILRVMAKELTERKPSETFLAHVLWRVKSKVDDGDDECCADVFIIPLSAMQESPNGGANLINFLFRDLYLSDEFNITEVS